MNYNYDLSKAYFANNVYPAPSVGFRSNYVTYTPNTLRKDSFNSNPLYSNPPDKGKIEALARSNPQIMSILKEYNIPLKANIKELETLQKGHLRDTRVVAAKLYSNLPPDIKQKVNLMDLQQAAMLHDYGKVLIPEKILNKPATLTDEEKEVIKLHPILGYELLKQQGVNENVLNLVKYHHQNPKGSGYPKIGDDYIYGYDSQILNAADKYSALVEKRSYKEAMTKEQALDIISHDVESGEISPQIFEALKKIT